MVESRNRRSFPSLPTPYSLLPLFFALALTFTLLVTEVNAREAKLKLQEWQMNGILAALDDGYPGVRRAAFRELAGYDAKDLKAFPKQSEEIAKRAIEVVNDIKQHPFSRSSAAKALVKLGKTDTSIVRFLSDLAKTSQGDSNSRYSAISALGNLDKADANVVQILSDLVKNEKEEFYLRSSAAEALGNLNKADASIVQVLYDLVRYSRERAFMRSSAVEALGSLDKADTSVMKFLLDLVKNDKEDSELRISAVEALGSLDKADTSVVKFLLDLVKNDKEDSELRISAAKALVNLGKADTSIVQFLSALVKNDKEDSELRIKAASTLGNLGKTDTSSVHVLSTLIKNAKEDSYLRSIAAGALGKIESLDLSQIFVFINATHDTDFGSVDVSRFTAYYYSRGEADIKTLLKWVGRPESLPDAEKLTHAERRKALEVFQRAWSPSQDFQKPRVELARAIARVTSRGKWQMGDARLLEQHYKNLSDAKYDEAAAIEKALNALTVWKRVKEFGYTIATHLLFWFTLIFAYPKSPQIQAIFFWNPWVRTILGFGYVSFLLTWIPFLRRKLFAPFRFSLLADAGLNHFHPDLYFPASTVRELAAGDEQPIMQVIPEIKGQVILEGDSGLGKTMFLRHLLQQSKRIVVYLPATKCAEGVIEAIQKKLHGDEIKDTKFLQSLIYSGAIDICIDGLNEVNPDTRARITQFVESHFKGNILMTTQPLEWLPPSTAKTYVMQPLQSAQIERYLLSRQPSLPKTAPVQGTAYEQACRTFLATMLSAQTSLSVGTVERQVIESSGSTAESPPSPQVWGNQTAQSPPKLGDLGGATERSTANLSSLSPEELKTARAILSNPMELTLAAWMLAGGVQPDLFNLREQQYKLMAEEYRRTWNQDFPLKQFSEAVYQQWLLDQKALPADKFYNELLCMEDEKFRMVVSRQWKDAKGEAKKEWYFRHDKIAEFFLVQTFLGKGADAETRLLDHIGDSRFRGVYFLLATLMDLEAAKDLREKLIQYAADTKDHTVSDTFVQLLRSR